MVKNQSITIWRPWKTFSTPQVQAHIKCIQPTPTIYGFSLKRTVWNVNGLWLRGHLSIWSPLSLLFLLFLTIRRCMYETWQATPWILCLIRLGDHRKNAHWPKCIHCFLMFLVLVLLFLLKTIGETRYKRADFAFAWWYSPQEQDAGRWKKTCMSRMSWICVEKILEIMDINVTYVEKNVVNIPGLPSESPNLSSAPLRWRAHRQRPAIAAPRNGGALT